MTVYINLKPVEVSSPCTLSELLEQCGHTAPGIAVAIDEKVISRKFWPSTDILPNAKITIIKAVCGG